MKIEITKRFVKDTQKIADKRILLKIQQVLLEAQKIENLICMNDLEEMSGYPNFYRIKFDYRYRIGIYFENETVQFLRVGSRESFYKKFP
ncbi:MAG: type II toxin-antitoxin system RelE/ParE family toxin [Methylococcaceae bacterium]